MSPRNDDPDEWGTWPGEAEWHPSRQDPGIPDVDWAPPEPIGVIELPDGTEIEVFDQLPSFGFGRWLDR